MLWTMLWILLSLLCVKYIFFWLYRSVGFEENIKFAKKNFRHVINKIVFTSSETTVILFICNLASISCGFRYSVEVNCLAVSSKRDLKED